MPDPVPVRLRLSRLAGANLHAQSYAVNSLPCRVVTRATWAGNPFRIVRDEGCLIFTTTQGAEVVAQHRAWLCDDAEGQKIAERIRAELPGHNIACACRLCPRHTDGLPLGEVCPTCAPCHGDTILHVAAGHSWDRAAGAWNTDPDLPPEADAYDGAPEPPC